MRGEARTRDEAHDSIEVSGVSVADSTTRRHFKCTTVTATSPTTSLRTSRLSAPIVTVLSIPASPGLSFVRKRNVEVQITIREGQGYVTGLPQDEDFMAALLKETSFRPAGFQYTKAFKRGKSDGRVKLFKHSKFPAGLLGRVSGVLRDANIPYALDIEQSAGQKPSIDVGLVGIESRPYQDEAVEKAILIPRGVIRAPTGSGKTAIGARIIAARAKWALVVVPTIDLLHQYRDFLEAHLVAGDSPMGAPISIGQLGDGVVDPQPITVATVRTAAKAMNVAYEKYEFGEYDDKDDTDVTPAKLRSWLEQIGTLIVDEAHILGAQTVYDLATKLPAPNKYGMSASPWRDDGADLMIEAATGPEIYRIETTELVDAGFLVPPIIQVVDTKGHWNPAAWGQTCANCGTTRWMTDKGPVKRCSCGAYDNWRSEFGDAYREEIVENPVRNQLVAEWVQRLDGPTLLLVKQIKHGKLLKDLIPNSRFLSGKDPGAERVEVYNQIRDENLQVVIATTIADLGLDIPALQNLVLAGGGKSSTRHLQRIGRVARPYPGKTVARVVDFDDGHVHKWFREQAKARRKIEKAEWGNTALWI